jgi:ABC-2 type transport system ATP-binding protein
VSSTVIEVEGLRKVYRRLRGGQTVAVDGLDLSVPEGGVFGFLGPNGAGKTTTIRCLLGLVRPSQGRCRLLGAQVPGALASVITKVGAIVEAPALYPRFSGRFNLLLLGRLQGIGPRAVDAALEQMGLADRAEDQVRTYSLGMKQRLGIAAALLKDPQVLILDEPANGLDPAGIKEVRDLVRRLGKEGRTVFVSSHQLAEVQQMCDQVAILSRGRRVASGPVAEVLSMGRQEALIVRVGDLPAALTALRSEGMPAEIHGDEIRVAVPATDASRITEVLARQGLYLSELRPEAVSLEDVFLQLTQEPAAGPGGAAP